MQDKFQNIPEELKKLPRWVCWKIEDRNGRPTKVPVNPNPKRDGTYGRAMSNNQSTWGSYEVAIKCLQEMPGLAGIGFMLGDGFVGVDIDDAEIDGVLASHARDIVATLDSFTEYSPSGKGLHVICRGQLPEGRRQVFIERDGLPDAHLGIYDERRFFCMTGNLLDDGHATIEERTEELGQIYKRYIVQKSQKISEKTQKNEQKPFVFVNDDEIIEKAMAAKNGQLFTQLMNGIWEGVYPSQSEADLALCNILAFWCPDAAQVDRIFRRSGLMRPKWDEKHGDGGTYGQMTIAKAIADRRETYNTGRKQTGAPDSNNETKKFTSDDLGRSQRFSYKYKGQVLWCQDMKSWLIWNGKYWEIDRTLKIHALAKNVIENLIEEASEIRKNARNEEEAAAADKMFKEAMKARSEKAIKSMIELAKSDLPITANELDADPFLLNCQNGVVDLKTGQLRPHDPKLLMSKIAGASYKPNRSFQLFEDFLELITCGDAELEEYFQVICGMAAIGKVFYEGIAIFYGTGQNGKSTFLNTIAKVFGDYAGLLNPELLMAQKDGRQAVGLADIRGKRFVTAIETEEGKRISSATLKQLASTDQITARRLYENPITFIPTHTLIMATNFLPKISSTDTGTWRRIAVVPFRANIEEEEQIKDYASILYKEDADAILSWIVEGAMKYIKNHYNIKLPQVVQDATKEYRQSEDWLGNFISECCIVGPDYEEEGGKLYEKYCEWCEKNGETYKRRPRDFAAALNAAGYEKRRMMRGSVWFGLKIIDDNNNEKFHKWHSVSSNFWNELP